MKVDGDNSSQRSVVSKLVFNLSPATPMTIQLVAFPVTPELLIGKVVSDPCWKGFEEFPSSYAICFSCTFVCIVCTGVLQISAGNSIVHDSSQILHQHVPYLRLVGNWLTGRNCKKSIKLSKIWRLQIETLQTTG